jgi:hypothetical protein
MLSSEKGKDKTSPHINSTSLPGELFLKNKRASKEISNPICLM